MNLSPNFTLEELTFSQYALRMGIVNSPAESQVDNLTRLCNTLLEPARALLKVPLHVDSGYRSPLVNSAVGGTANSAHTDGRAADLVPIGMPIQEAFDLLRKSDLPYDQIIFECASWIHLAIASVTVDARKQMLTATGSPGHWHYVEVT